MGLLKVIVMRKTKCSVSEHSLFCSLHISEQDEIMNMNLLLYSPSGTGKSELAIYIENIC